jgi:D-alanine-D-alanine ligase
VPVVEYAAVRRARFEADPAAFAEEAARLPGPPWFVKPSVGGSSVGVKKVADRADLVDAVAFALRFDDAVLVERGVAGRELEVAVLGHRELAASEVGEIVPGREFYDYEDKYLTDGAELIAPAVLAPGIKQRLQETAVAAFAALGGSGMARVDFLLEVHEGGGETANVNEINTLPGFTSISMYPRLWGLSGVPLAELTDRLVTHALERHADRRRLDDGIKEFLSSLAEETAGA